MFDHLETINTCHLVTNPAIKNLIDCIIKTLVRKLTNHVVLQKLLTV